MPNPDIIDKLYDNLKEDGWVENSRQNFRQYFLAPGEQGYKNRKALYENMKEDGYVDSPTYEEFAKRLGLGAQKRAATQPQRTVKPTLQPTAVNTQPRTNTAPAQPKPTVAPQPAPWTPETFNATDYAQRLSAGANRWETTEEPEDKKIVPTEEQMRTAGQRMRDELDYSEATGKRLKRDDRVVKKEWEAPTVLRDEEGNMATGPDGQPVVGSTTDEERVAQYNEQERHMEEVAKRKTIEEQIDDAYNEREEIDKAIHDKYGILSDALYGHGFEGMVKRLAGTFTGLPGMNANTIFNNLVNGDKEGMELMTRSHLNDERIRALEAERDNAGLVGGFVDKATKFDYIPLINSGVTDAVTMYVLGDKIEAARKLGVKPNLTESEKKLVDTYFASDEAQALDANRNWWYNFGGTAAESLEFMAEFLATGGGMGVANALTRGGTKLGLKAAQSSVGRAITKNFGTIPMKVVQSTLKGTGRVAGAAAGGAIQSNTIGFNRTWTDIIEKQAGNLTFDKWGDLSVENREGLAKSIIMGQIEAIGENGSELLGPAFDFMPKYLSRVIQKKIGSNAISRFMNSQIMRKGDKFLSHAGIQGVFGEGMEEEANALLDDIKGRIFDPNNPNNSNFFDGQERIDRWLTTAALGVFLRVPQTVATGYQKAMEYGYKYNLNEADKRASELFGADRWNVYRDQLDNTENKDLGKVVNEIINEPSLNDQEKEAVMLYAGDLMKVRASNLGALAMAQEGVTPRPRTNSYNIRGNVIEEVDDQGNVIETHEYEDREGMKAGLFGLQQTRANNDMLSDIVTMMTRPDNAYDTFITTFAGANGITPEELRAMIDEDPMKRDEAAQQIISDFSTQLHNEVYNNSNPHTEQSFIDGQDAADAATIDVENPDLSVTQPISDEWAVAKQSREELFARNEEMKQEVEAMEQQGLSPQEIIQRLDTFRPEDVQTLIGYYNSRAKFGGMMARTSEKVEEHVANERERRTFKGTINGNEEANNLVEITDGANTFTLVSGNLTTDSEGRVTDSDSGMLIGMDQEGNFVSLSDTSGFTVVPTQMSLDDWAAAYQEEIGANLTESIDPDGTLMEDGTEEYVPETAETGTQEVEPVPETSEEVAVEEAPEEKVTIENVTGEDGVKRYEQGISIEDAIADIQNDGLDVNEEADLAINEAQTELNKIKQPKTRADRVKNAARQKELQDIIDYYTRLKQQFAAQQQPEQAEKPVSQPRLTAEEQKQQRITEAKEKYGELFDDDFTKANDVFELVSMWVGRKRNLAWEDVNGNRGLQKELGWSRKIGGDTKYIETLLAKNGEGMGVDEFVHMVWESPENDVMGEKRYDTDEIKNALLELLRGAASKSDVVDYALNTRIANAETNARQQMEDAEAQPLPTEQQEIPSGGLPFGAPTNEDFTNVVNENSNVEGNNVSLQSNTENDEQTSMGGQDQEGDGISREDETASNVLRGISIAASETGQGGGSKQRLLAQLEESARNSGHWIDDDISQIEELKVNVGGENEVYKSIDGSVAIKLNNFNFLRDDATNFEDFINRIESFNELFPDVPVQVLGFAKNSKGEVCVVLQQPWIEAEREATEEEIDSALEEMEFYTDIKGDWTDGRYDISDLKPNNVLVDKEGNLHFIDVVTFDSTKPGQMMMAKKPEAATQPQPTEKEDDYLEPRNQKEEKIVADVRQQLNQEIDAAVKEVDKAASELQKARARESEKATDMFSDDNALNQPGQLFDNSDMPVDRSIEGVERRTESERKRFEEARKKLDKLQSVEERNSRIRGALDNERRQTSFDDTEKQIDERHKQEYEQYIKPLLNLSDEQLQQLAKRKEDAVGGDLKQLEGDLEYSAIQNVLLQREYDRQRKDAKIFIANTIDDEDVSFVDKLSLTEFDKLQSLINEYGIDDTEGKIEKYVKQQRKKYPAGNEISTANPIEAIEQAAQSFNEEREAVKNYGADNKLVTTDRYEELKKRMKEKLRGQLNAGFDPEILMIGSEMAMYHIEAGARTFADYATRMILDLGDVIRPYLKAFYESARRMPGMEELSKEMDSTAYVDDFDVQNYDKQVDNSVNVNKQVNNETENVVSSQQETQEESAETKPQPTEKEAERKAEDADKYRQFSQAVASDMLNAMETGEKPYRSINDIRKKAKEVGLEVDDEGRTDILLQELVEDGLVSAARQYVNTYVIQQMFAGKTAQEARTSRDLFNDIVKLYDLQPSITQRSSNRIKMQQYSTPLPMSFIADVFAYKEGMEDVLEPTAGNGMMVFAVPEFTVHANELDGTRLDNLRAQKFKKVTDQDATKPFEGEEQYDAVIANPPFGSAPAKEYDGKEIPGLAEQIAINALSKMKDDGKAAIIIGGNMEYAPNGAIKNQKAFFTYLYDHYNVKGVIDMDGKLYSKQGTTYPTRMILIDGRRSEEERAQVKVYPPVQSLAPKKATTFDELFDIAEKIRKNKYKTNGTEILRTPTGIALPDTGNAPGNTDGSRRSGQPRQNESDERRAERGGSNQGSQKPTSEGTTKNRGRRSVGVQQPGIPGLFDTEENPSEPQPQTGTSEGRAGNMGDAGRVQSGRLQGVGTSNSRVGLTQQKPKEEEKRDLETEKLSYRPHNTAFSLESVAPAAMVEAMDDVLSKIEKKYGNIDEWVTKELGYDTIDEMHSALAAEQVDSVAMAIYQMKQGQGMIIGDQTGVGKGRQMAALIRWACKQGKRPVFITQKDDLFSDLYRDLVDIGSGELNPFIFNAATVSTDKETGEKKYMGGVMIDGNGNLVYRALGKSAQDAIFESGELPPDYDFAVLTYSQVNTGDKVSQEEAREIAKKNKEWTKKKKEGKQRPTPKATFLRALAKDNYMFLDESHTAAGKSNTGAYFQSILKTAKAVTFASATFAKRPDTMPMYAIRTAMAQAKVKAEELIKIIENGGVTLQEIMSRALTQAGQMVRRERDMSDVKTDWKTVDDPETVKKARDNYDKTIMAFNAIIDFQKTYVAGFLDSLSRDLASVASTAGMRQGTEDLGIKNVPFASKTYNYTKQLMLALKVDAIVDEVVKEIEAGRHPVIALENTMGSLLGEYSPGDTIKDTTFAASLLKGLKGILRYTITDEDGKQIQMELTPEQLGSDGAAAYHEVEDLIRESTSGIFISPLDAIIEKLDAKGYKVGELTGRNETAVLDENTGEYKVQRRTDKDKKKLARDFNNGTLDVLILNKSASTGISLHASEKFSDQRQRSMIIAQPLADINDYMQMIGRIDRTGQVHRGYYINLGLPVPAEGRFLMMLSTKLKSLNANTTTSQESESNDVEAPDLLNKYGSKVVIEYLRDNPDIYVKMGEPLKKDNSRVSVNELDGYEAQEDDARKITGYVALLPTDEQDAFYNDVVRRYTELIQYLNDTGSNDLKISVLPLRARTIDKQVSSEGADPTGENPFAKDAYVEWVEMDVLKKPMRAAEIGKVIEQLNPEVENAPKVKAKTAAQEKMLAGKLTPRVRQIIETVKRETQAKMDKENERYEAAKKRAEEDIVAKSETINKQEKRTAEQKQEAIDKYAADRRQSVEESHQNIVNKIDANNDRLMKYLTQFKVGDSVLVPDYLSTDTFIGSSHGIFCGFKAKEEGITPSTTLAVFATLDGRRKVEVKLSDWSVLLRIDRMTMDNWDAAQEVTLNNWDEQIPSETRKHGYIMTGNILQAFADAGENGRVPGQLVTYTDIDGNVHDGILMNQHWEPSQLKGSTVPLKNRMEEIKNLKNFDHIVSADGNVVIERSYGYYTITVPKSKKLGAQYYENNELLDLVDDRNFFPYRGQLKGDILPENIEKAVNVLSDLGVQVKSENQVKFDNETEMGQAQAGGRFNYSQKSLSHETKTNDSTKKDVPLTQRHSKSYTDAKGNYHRGIEEDLSELEDRISRAGKESFGISEQGSESSQGVQPSRPNPIEINELRKEAAQLRAEIASRSQKRQELRKQYNIDEKGNISLDDLSRMFHDLNRSEVLDKLFDKVVAVLKNLGVEFRFTDNLKGNVGGNALAFINVTFYNWDAQLRDLDNQEKARILLHEMIHNVTSHIIDRYKKPSLGKLTPKQERLAKEIVNIYNKVKSTNPVRENGESPYGLENEYEMLSELANPEFRRTLDSIKYRGNMSILEGIKQWFRKLFGLNTALDSLEKALDDILESYDENENKVYRQQRTDWENQMRDAGVNLDYVDFWETGLGMLGRQAIVKDKSEIERLENEPKEKGYRTVVQNTDGTFGSPMAGRLSGKKGQQSKPTSSYRMGEWERSEENPQLATDNGKINLIKPGGLGTVGSVDYNPYIHIRENKLNKQFKNAWERPDLVYIEVDYPASETTSGYRAEKAAKTVGRHKWPGGDLILSRWDKPVRIVPWNEVADDWEREFKNRGVEFDIVSPHLLPILVKRGVEILPPHKGMGEECKKAYEAFKAKQDANPMNAIQRAARQFNKNTEVEANPLEAIRKAAEGFARESNINNPQNPLNSSKKAYNERLNRIETVFAEAYQDAMVSLKTAQNAIAGDKEIPDSQNAYMAENLMHGKNKNEMDLFNMMYRDPMIATINKIMNLTGMNWGDVDRYVYTKSGLERNREFFVRDFLETERNKAIRKYEDLSPEAQDIYDSMAATIEDMFEDGDIDEEEKNKKLSQALQKAHQKHIDEVENEYLSEKSSRYQDMQDGYIDFAGYLNAIDNFIRRNIDSSYKPEEHDYSGFRAMFGDEDGEYDEGEIIDELMNTEGKIESENVDKLWEQINAATRYGLERYREAGMRTDEQIDQVEQMFHFYVPMRGFKENKGEDMYQYFTGKDKAKSYIGGLLKHAKGRGSEANFPISTIFSMTYKAISDCNQNLVKQKFYRLCQANPNDLVVLSDSWAVLNETTGEWEEVAPDIPDDASEEDVREATLAFEEEMRDLANENKAKKIKGRERFDYRPIDKKKQSEHIVDVRINGQPRKIIVTGNPRMAQALNGQLRFENGRNVFSKVNAYLKNLMASLFTSYSPTFALRNMARDWTHFRMMTGVREGEGYAHQADKYYRQSLFKMVGLFKKYRNGTLDERNEMERDFKDFMDNGGITGFVFMQKAEDIQKQMSDLLKKQKQGKAIRLNDNLWTSILHAVEAINEGIENNARFATYRASRHYAGRTKARSAYDAKEITANFNRKGAGGRTAGFKSPSKAVEDAAKVFGVTSQIAGEGRIFFNATVQAIATTFKNFQNPDGSLNKKYIAKWAGRYALPPFAFGLALPFINRALVAAFGGDDDDPYANLPEWTRRRNLCFYVGNNNFITIPIGQELAAFLALGDMIAGHTYAPELKPVNKSIDDELLSFFNVFSPIDIDTNVTKGGLAESPLSEIAGRTFSVLSPLIAVEQNLSWTGRPIYKEDRFKNDKFIPEYQRVYSSTNPVLVEGSRLLNEWTGGNERKKGSVDVNPAIVQYLWEQYTGGPGKVFSNTISMGKDAKDLLIEGEAPNFNIRKIEGVKAFVQQGDDRTQYYRTKEKFRKYTDEADAYLYENDITNLEKLAKKGDQLSRTKLEELQKSKDYVKAKLIKEANRQDKESGKIGLDDFYRDMNKLTGKERREAEMQYNKMVKELVDLLDEADSAE